MQQVYTLLSHMVHTARFESVKYLAIRIILASKVSDTFPQDIIYFLTERLTYIEIPATPVYEPRCTKNQQQHFREKLNFNTVGPRQLTSAN